MPKTVDNLYITYILLSMDRKSTLVVTNAHTGTEFEMKAAALGTKVMREVTTREYVGQGHAYRSIWYNGSVTTEQVIAKEATWLADMVVNEQCVQTTYHPEGLPVGETFGGYIEVDGVVAQVTITREGTVVEFDNQTINLSTPVPAPRKRWAWCA